MALSTRTKPNSRLRTCASSKPSGRQWSVDNSLQATLSQVKVSVGQADISDLLSKYHSEFISLNEAQLDRGILIGTFSDPIRPYTKTRCDHITAVDCVLLVSQLAYIFGHIVVAHTISPRLSDVTPKLLASASDSSRIFLTRFNSTFRARVGDNGHQTIAMTIDRICRWKNRVFCAMSFSISDAIIGQTDAVVVLRPE